MDKDILNDKENIWKLEEENKRKLKIIKNKIICIDEFSCDKKVNAMYINRDTIKEKNQYWEFSFNYLKSSIFIGFTNEKYFDSGYGITGLLYGGSGNLSNGSSFGNEIKSGDKVGIILNTSELRLQINIIHNDILLGTAFEIPSPYPTNLHPVISFSGKGEVILIKKKIKNMNEKK